MVPIGKPDDFQVERQGEISPIQDLGELASRLGSPAAYHRSGDVIWIDSFEYGIGAWITVVNGANTAFVKDTARWNTKGASGKVTVGNTSGDDIQLSKYLSPIYSGTMCLSTAIDVDAPMETIRIGLVIVKDDTAYDFIVRFNYTAETVEYQDSSGTFQTLVSNFQLSLVDKLFYRVEIYLDYDAKEYVKVRIGETDYDLSDEAAYAYNYSSLDTIIIDYFIENQIAADFDVYIDYVMVTVNE